ncbi:mitochondrial fission ELM1 family protein [Stappia stellulata]|uniref:mitochondrial fission ELM1 family protein n=1 Tax=Stappia stellulata TaxID=71235 RepID=UPI000427C8E0|nr:mitochondrial fission ELM1 family protein [Stappia stellulata]
MNKKYHESETAVDDARIWIVSDGKAGDETQCIGVAEALGGRPHELRRVAPRAPWSWLMPWTGIDPRDAPDKPGSPIAPPFPDIAIASGRRAVAYLARIKRDSGGRTFTVFLKDPRIGTKAADLIWVAEHDRLRGDNVLVTASGPHRFSQARIEAARAAPLPDIAALAHPRVAVLVGGDSRTHRFLDLDVTRFVEGLERIADDGARLMITPSRRTPQPLLDALAPLATSPDHVAWSGEGENPLLQYLANADAIVATADSANMIGEALATGRPVHVFHPSGGHRKFNVFLEALTRIGAVHPFPGRLKTTTYEPIDSTPRIAQAIKWAYATHRAGIR